MSIRSDYPSESRAGFDIAKAVKETKAPRPLKVEIENALEKAQSLRELARSTENKLDAVGFRFPDNMPDLPRDAEPGNPGETNIVEHMVLINELLEIAFVLGNQSISRLEHNL